MCKIVAFDPDETEWVGNHNDGCYVQTAKGPDGWYVTVVVDCESAHFVDDLLVDDGPYITEHEARTVGNGVAYDWCADNNVCIEH